VEKFGSVQRHGQFVYAQFYFVWQDIIFIEKIISPRRRELEVGNLKLCSFASFRSRGTRRRGGIL